MRAQNALWQHECLILSRDASSRTPDGDGDGKTTVECGIPDEFHLSDLKLLVVPADKPSRQACLRPEHELLVRTDRHGRVGRHGGVRGDSCACTGAWSAKWTSIGSSILQANTAVLACMMRMLICIALCGAAFPATRGATTQPAPLPLFFVPNQGQFAPDVRFGAIGGGMALAVGDRFLRMLAVSGGEEQEVFQSELRWQGSSPDARVLGMEEANARYSFFLGDDPKKWRSDLPAYRQIRIQNLYPGIDLLIYWNGTDTEFDFELAPGADPRLIRWNFSSANGEEGATAPGHDATSADQLSQSSDSESHGSGNSSSGNSGSGNSGFGNTVSLDESGALVVGLASGNFLIRRPVAYQDRPYGRLPVAAEYALQASGYWGLNIGDYDRDLPLIIDPILHYSTYYGGAHFDQANAITTDHAGNAYVVGETWSADLLLHLPVQGQRKAGKDVFVLRMNEGLNNHTAATYFGGNGDDIATAAVIAGGDLVIGGETSSTDLPGSGGGFQPSSGGGKDGFLTRLRIATTSSIEATTYLGGFGVDRINAVTGDIAGNVYAAGYTTSSNFPIVTPSFGPTYKGGLNDAFVVKLGPALNQVAWSGIYGGLGADNAEGIATGADGSVWITGATSSFGLPTVNAAQNVLLGAFDCFVARISEEGATLSLSTYIGGLGSESCYAIKTDANGNAVVAGSSASADFPATAGAYQVARSGSYDNVLFQIDASSGNIAFSTYLGGTQTEAPTSLFRDHVGNWCMSGYTLSTNFPVVEALQPNLAGSIDGFLSCLSSNGQNLVFSTYLGGTEEDRITSAVEHPGGMTLLTGLTQSTNFPVTTGALQASTKGNGDAFLTAIERASLNVMPVNVSASPSMGSTEVAHITYTVEDANGYSDVRYVYTLIHNVVSAVGGCYVRYDADANDLRLLSDDGAYWAGLAKPGENVILQNSQCKIDASKSSVWGHATRLQVKLHYTFQPGFGGVKSLLIYSQDRAGSIVGWQLRGGWEVPALAGNLQPAVTYFMPNSGTFPSNAFVIQTTDSNGASDIQNVDFVVNNTLVHANSCYVRYNRSLNQLQLLSDDTSQFLGNLTPGTAGTVENSKCILSSAASAASQSGNVLTLVVYLSFKALAAGPNNAWTLVSDQSNVFLGWKLQGSFTVPIGPAFSNPVAESATVTPSSSATATIDATVSDENGSLDIRDIYVLVNAGLSYANGCFLQYQGDTGRVLILNDAGTAWQAFGTLGQSGVLENSQCVVDLASSSISSTEETKTISYQLTFKSGFGGTRQVYVYAEDQAKLVSGWKNRHSISLPFPQ